MTVEDYVNANKEAFTKDGRMALEFRRFHLHGMKVVVIGGTGHIGSYLCPQLVEAGCGVVCVSRGLRSPY
ncbi:MAG: hypothetical protein J2P52_09880 [Blastocatellia bacterium]|nr:hypothetical protein [Blastocatellia bacterium]